MSRIRFHHVNLVIRGRTVLQDISWSIDPHQNWVVIGPNGAGKTSLFKIILGHIYYRGDLYTEAGLREQTAYVSFDRQSDLMRREALKDHARHFSGNFEQGVVTAATLLPSLAGNPDAAQKMHSITVSLGIDSLLEREIRLLSTGEMRKMLIAEALMSSPRLLILDEPYDGLDHASAQSLGRLLERLMSEHVQVLMVTHRFEEIPYGITHVLCMKQGEIYRQGEKEIVLDRQLLKDLYGNTGVRIIPPDKPRLRVPTVFNEQTDSLIRMVNVTVKYGEKILLEGVNWNVKKGENWLIVGPNGAGKSTLLSLITADNPQAYANEIYLFGRRRGTGESIWDIKQKIGLVSSEFHIRYTLPSASITGYQVLLSGFFDSVGLFRQADETQRRTAMQWLQELGLAAYADRVYAHLSYGEQRMLLIARAMVKSPDALVLDEPFQGVDYANRRLLMDLIDDIGTRTATTILYVTHQQETLACITHTLAFRPDGSGGYRVVQTALTRGNLQ